jgi:hypothetical protein
MNWLPDPLHPASVGIDQALAERNLHSDASKSANFLHIPYDS